MKSEYKPVINTSIWSLIILGVYLSVLYVFKDFVFKWEDPTSEIRNVVLMGAAMIGIPFLVLGHITRRQDFESKRKDLNYRSEASINEFLMNQITASAERFSEIIKIDFTIPGREFQTSRTSNISNLLHYTINDPKYQQYDILTALSIDNLTSDLWFHFPSWQELNKHIQIIITSLRTKRDFANDHFGKILSINLSSYIDSESYTILILILCLKEFRSIDLDDSNSELFIALQEANELIDLKIFPNVYSELARKEIQKFIVAEGMLRGREQ